jgi:uncharacterized repeat protein (TIGR01451 family)
VGVLARFGATAGLALVATTTLAHAQSADLSLSMTVSDPTPLVGAQVSFEVTIQNAGPNSVQRVVVRDKVPNGYAYVSHSATRGTYDPVTGRWLGFGVVLAGSERLTLTATVKPGGNYKNVANLMSSNLPDPDSTPGNYVPTEDDYAQLTTTPVTNVTPIITGQLPLKTGLERPLTITLQDLIVTDPDNDYPDDFTLSILPGAGYTVVEPDQVVPGPGFIGALTVALTVSDGTSTSPPFDAAVTVRQPNLVVIMADDLDTRTLGDLLNAGLMPNLQTYFIDRGVTFTSSYTSDPLCCPSRATFFTGQYAHNHGIFNNVLDYGGTFGLDRAVGQFDDTDTLPVKLQALGYTTAYFGKYLNGYGADPGLAFLSPAFDPHYVPPGWTSWNGLIDLSTYCVYNYSINHNGVPTQYLRPSGKSEDTATYQTNVLADLVEDFVVAHRDDAAPFFLNVMTLTPHGERCSDCYGGPPPPGDDNFKLRIRPAPEDKEVPVPAFVQTPSFNEDLADKPTWLSTLAPPLTSQDVADITEQYTFRLRAMLSVDRLLGRMAVALGDHLDDTVLVFTSDNGWLYGEHRRSGKIYAYRESSRVPLYVAYPAYASGVRPDLVINNDLHPTLLDLASPGYVDPVADGRSLVALLRAPEPGGWVDRQRILMEYGRANPAATFDIWPTYFAIHTPTQTYIESYDDTWYFVSPPLVGLERYDLVADPYEMNSLIRYPQNPRDPVFAPILDQLRTCTGATCRVLEDAP